MFCDQLLLQSVCRLHKCKLILTYLDTDEEIESPHFGVATMDLNILQCYHMFDKETAFSQCMFDI